MGLPAVNQLLPFSTGEVNRVSSQSADTVQKPEKTFQELLNERPDNNPQEPRQPDQNSEPHKIHEYQASQRDNQAQKEPATSSAEKPKVDESNKASIDAEVNDPTENASTAKTKNTAAEDTEQGNSKKETNAKQSAINEHQHGLLMAEQPLSVAKAESGSSKSSIFEGIQKAGKQIQKTNISGAENLSNIENKGNDSSPTPEEKINGETQQGKALRFIGDAGTKSDQTKDQASAAKNLAALHGNTPSKSDNLATEQNQQTTNTIQQGPEGLTGNLLKNKEPQSKMEAVREQTLQGSTEIATSRPGANPEQGQLNGEQNPAKQEKFTLLNTEKQSSEPTSKSIASDTNFLQSLTEKNKATNVSRETILDQSTRKQVQQQIDSAWNRARFQLQDQKNVSMNTSIYPKELGRIQLSLSLIDGLLQARFIVDNEAVQKEVQSKMQQMAADLAEQGMTLNSFDVDLRQQNEGTGQKPEQQHMNRTFSSRMGDYEGNFDLANEVEVGTYA